MTMTRNPLCQIKNRLKDDAVTLALPSQRVDRFDDNIANIVGGTRTTGLTFAPEGGTQRMRDIINKVRMGGVFFSQRKAFSVAVN